MSTDAKLEVASTGGQSDKSVGAVNNTVEENSKPEEIEQEPPIIPGQVPEGYQTQEEGKATILVPQKTEAFYNPAQVVNRDLSVACLREFAKIRREEVATGKLKPRAPKNGAPRCLDTAIAAERRASDPEQIWLLEGLAASGLRAIRYALELDGVSRIDANDIDPKSAQAIRRNVAFNAGAAKDRVSVTQRDARVLMIERAGTYDAVDLDPYGSPCQLLDSAVQAVAEGGMLMVTATDMAVLCGNHGESCWSKYGSYPLHRPYCHEQALRILLAAIQSHAARHKRVIVPMLSLSIDFYVRVFVRVFTSPKDVKDCATKLMYVYQSTNCDSFYCQPVGRKDEKNGQPKHSAGRGPCVPEKCPETGSGFMVGGSFWSAPLHDAAFVQGVLQDIQGGGYQASSKLNSLLTLALEELPDVPLYYNLHDLSKVLKTQAPPQDTFRSALVNAGHRVSSTHANPLAVKTDAPPSVVWDVMRAWVKKQGKEKAFSEDSPAHAILGKEVSIQVDFSRAKGAASQSRLGKLTRFPTNPEANWGPMRKHTRQAEPEEQAAKRVKRGGKMSGLEDMDPQTVIAAPVVAKPDPAVPQPEQQAKES